MSATYVIGDMHGALKALQQLIERISPEKDDRFIFLGDYVDGWSESAQLISWLMELEKQYTCIFIKGNHDAWCEAWLAGEQPVQSWLQHGGTATAASYKHLSGKEKLHHLAFFNRMLNYYEDDHRRLFIHAGFASLHGPSHERFQAMHYWDRTLWELAMCMDKRLKKDSRCYPKRLLLYDEIYIGHTPTLNYDETMPMNAVNVFNIDTGAAFTGRISAMNIETKEVWQSDVVQMLYPDEKGRNN
ncbi:metallophosphoesterase [Chitinophaga solisilvae]|uniref:Serine/threonine protein phosphatase n=1 Tax=Chitinophaga solisilvae TaxID=1233460 RepID=A0A3S1D4K8_9BACT|nr:metallophosphoesterase [Chitinophaga solisilvae]NSL90720.1 serine/threonine protein phosphatase [Chitinophaga solisilvae]